MNKKLLVETVLILIVASINVLAIGITPGQQILDFKPGMQQDVNFKILNNEKKAMEVEVYVEDSELSEIVKFDQTILSFYSDEESKDFSFRVNMPQEIEEPGEHVLNVVVVSKPKLGEGQAFVGATAAVTLLLKIRVPYPGKYAKIDLGVSEAKKNEMVAFAVPVWNLGTSDINGAEAEIVILDPKEKEIAKIKTDKKDIKSRNKDELTASWLADVPIGVYTAVASLNYGGKKDAKAEKIFNVGHFFIDILDISVKDFSLGQVAKFTINVENKWNDLITDVVPEMILMDDEGNRIANIKGADEDIGALEKKSLYAYWDTEGIKEGVYSGKAILHYKGVKTEMEMETTVGLNSIRVSLLAPTGRVVEGGGNLGRNSLIVVLVLLFIIVNVGWVVYVRKIKR